MERAPDLNCIDACTAADARMELPPQFSLFAPVCSFIRSQYPIPTRETTEVLGDVRLKCLEKCGEATGTLHLGEAGCSSPVRFQLLLRSH